MIQLPDPVTSATAVYNINCRVVAISRAMDTISEFLDYSRLWSLPDACGFQYQDGALRLAKRVMIHEAIEAQKAEKIVAEEVETRAKTNLNRGIVVPRNINAALRLRKRDDSFFRQREFTLAMAKAAARCDLNVMSVRKTIYWLLRDVCSGRSSKEWSFGRAEMAA
ncbi:unnamed protein product [Peronospora belbahrii]|uniref:Uncharacterized protein n=1 Tax=Peronospora belbahrii TaxID=622444 RepID=A0ABN8CT87_9STRA|nr:unnamed protein product [Peronospora belbahrii]